MNKYNFFMRIETFPSNAKYFFYKTDKIPLFLTSE